MSRIEDKMGSLLKLQKKNNGELLIADAASDLEKKFFAKLEKRAESQPHQTQVTLVTEQEAVSPLEPHLDVPESPLEKKISGVLEKSKIFIPEKEAAPQKAQQISREFLLGKIKENLPGSEVGAGEKASTILDEIEVGFGTAAQCAKLVAGGSISYDVSQVAGGLILKLDTDVMDPVYAVLLKAFWSNLSLNIVSEFIKKNALSPASLKRIMIIDSIAPNLAAITGTVPLEVLLEKSLEYSAAYAALFVPAVLTMSSQDSQVHITRHSRVLQKDIVQEGMETILGEMIQDYRSRFLMRRVSSLGEVKQVMIVDELLKTLIARGIDINPSLFMNNPISKVYSELMRSVREQIYDASPITVRHHSFEDIFWTAGFYDYMGDYNRASACYGQAIRQKPHDETVISAFGKFLEKNNDAAGALRAYEEFLLNVPNSPVILRAKSTALRRLAKNEGQFKRVVTNVAAWSSERKAAGTQKANNKIHSELERILSEVVANPAISAEISPMIEFVRTKGLMPDKFYTLATLLAGKNLKKEALGVLTILNNNHPKNQNALYLAGRLAFELNKTNEAAGYLSRLNAPIENSEYILGQVYFDVKKFNKAVKHLGNWLKSNRADANAFRLRAYANWNLKKIDKAITDFKDVRSITKDDGDAAYALGQLYLGDKNYQVARDYFQIAASLDYKKVTALINIATCWSMAGLAGSALESLDSALSIEPRNSEALAGKCYVLAKLGRYEELEKCCNAALAVRPDLSDIKHMLDSALLRTMENAKASGDLETARQKATDRVMISSSRPEITQKDLINILLRKVSLKQDTRQDLESIIVTADSVLKSVPNDEFATYSKAVALHRLGDLASSGHLINGVLRINPENVDALKELGQIKLEELEKLSPELRNYGPVLEVLKKYVHLKQNDAIALKNISVIYYSQNNFDLALKYIESAERLTNSSEILANKAWILYKLKRYEPAAKSAESAIAKGAISDNIFMLRGQIAEAMGELQNAFSFYDYALRNTKEPAANTVIAYANVAIRLAKFNEAVSCLDSLLLADSQNAQAWVLRGDANSNLLRREDAVKDYSRAMELSNNSYVRQKLGRILFDAGDYAAAINILASERTHAESLEVFLLAHIKSGKQNEALALAENILSRQGAVNLKSISWEVKGDTMQEFGLKINCYLRAVDLSARPETQLKLAQAYAKVGDFSNATKQCDAAVAGGSSEATVLKNKILREDGFMRFKSDGDRNVNARNYGAAIKAYEQALGIKLDISVGFKKAKAEEADGRINDAISSLDSIVKEFKDAGAALEAGKLSYQCSALDRALEYYDYVLKIRPDNSEAAIGKSNILLMSNDAQGALEVLIAYNHNNKGYQDPMAWLGIGLAHAELGAPDEAIGDYDKALSIDKNCEPAILNKADALMSLKRFDEATSAYNSVLQRNANSTIALLGLSEICFETGKYDESLQFANRAAELEPQSKYAKERKINALEKLNRIADAALVLRELGDG